MKYTIEFIKGCLQGQSFDLQAGKALSLGRSHHNTVQLSEADVSGRHASIMVDPHGASAFMEVFSSGETLVNGREYSMGEKVELSPDCIVQMGRDVQFRLIRKVEEPATSNAPCVFANAKTIVPSAALSMQQNQSASSRPTISPGSIVPPSAVPTSKQDDIPANASVPSSSHPMVNVPPAPQTASVPSPSRPTVNVPSAPQTAVKPPQASVPSVEQKTSSAAHHTQLSPDATQAGHTRMASPEEIEALKHAYRSQQRRRLALLVVTAIGFFAVSVFLYMTLRPKREEVVTWPTDADGNELSEVVQTAPYLASLVPKVEGFDVQQDGGNAEIYTRVGKLRDVPLHILVSTWKSKDGLKQNRSEAFAAWLAKMRQKHPDMHFNGTGRVVFINVTQGSGVPITEESYTRRVGNDDFFGFVGYLRHAENVHLLMAEVPLAEQWRCEPLLRDRLHTNFIVYAIRRTADWWEGSSRFREESSIEEDLEEAARYLRRESPAFWEKIHHLTKSALIKAATEDNVDAQAKALDLLKRLRTAQASWYNAQKLAYQYASKSEDKATMRSIQSLGESIFSAEFQEDDYRYDYIRRKDWQ